MGVLGGIMGSMSAGANTSKGADAIQGLISQGQSGIQNYYDLGYSREQGAYQGAQGLLSNWFGQGTGAVSPWSTQGQSALASQASLLGIGGAAPSVASGNIGTGKVSQDPSQNPYLVSNAGAGFNAATNPGYQFAVQQGQQAINASAAQRGGLFSGANQKALDAFTVGQANQNFNQYISQQQNAAALQFANQQQAYGNVANLSGTGLTAGTTQANLAGTGMAGTAQLGVANMGDLTSLSTSGMSSLASLYGAGISGTANLYAANTAAQAQSWGQVGQAISSTGSMFGM